MQIKKLRKKIAERTKISSSKKIAETQKNC